MSAEIGSLQSWLRGASRAVALTVSMALVFTAVEAIEPAVAAAQVADPKPAPVASRPDVVSAAVSARAQGSRVEVESLRTETSTTWVGHDGVMVTEQHAADIRYRGRGGEWQDVDLALMKGTDGEVFPKGHAHDLRLGKRSDTPGGVFASAEAGAGRLVEWLAPWKLPEPSLEGTKVTYAEVQPGVDLVLDARRSGFEQDFVVKRRPATAPVWRIPLRTKGLTAKPQTDGSIRFVDAQNVVRSVIPVAYMWDAVTDPASGLPASTAPVKVTVEQQSPGRATLVIAPDAGWFMDPARVLPITVDPTYATGTVWGAAFDTWVRSDVTTDQSSSSELQVGSWNSGATKARSFLNWSTSTFSGKQILGATLSLWESWSHTCTPSTFLVKSATPASTSTRWTSQPAIGGQYGSATAARGHSSTCPEGRVEVPVTGLVQAWSTASYSTGGMAVVAADETDSLGWKRFHSTEGAYDPYITYTWNRAPATPATPTFASAVAYAPFGGSSVLYTPYLKPWVETKATDADGNNVRYTFEFHDSTTVTASSLKATCGTSSKASGTNDGCTPTVNLPDNTAIYVRAKATDDSLASGWSGWRLVRVATQTPAAPSISCPSPYVINSWQDTNPAGDVVCTITATGTGYSAPGYVRVTVDGKPYPTNFVGGAAGQIKITPSSDPAVAKTTVTISKNTSGLHRITAQAESPAGKLSGTTAYSFGWGAASMTQPSVAPRITTTGAINVQASGPPKGASETAPLATLRWRVSGYASGHETVGWNTSTPLTVTDNGTSGVVVTGTWDTTTATMDTNLDADPATPIIEPTTLNPRLPVLLDVQVCLTYASSTQCTWSETKTTVQRVPHAFGNGFPTAGAGPGQVALWTGEFNTDSTDISVPGYTGNLTLSRSHSTYAGATNTINGVFGPGWTAQFDGADAGAAGAEVVDSTRLDGTIALVDGDGTALVWAAPNGERRATADFTAGTWVPADEDTELDGSKLTVTGTGASTTISYIEDDGTVTTYTPAAAPTATGDTLFRPAGIAEPGVASKTTYSYDATGRVARILAPAPPGVTCPATGALNPGCRALRFDYGTTGDATGRLTGAWLDIYNPAKTGGPGMDSIKVADYTYETGGRLTKATDPRSGLSTEYGYNTANHLTSIKPAGQVPFQLVYTPSGDTEKLSEVKRDRPAGDPAGGTAQLAKFVYDVPLTGVGLPDLSATSVARWGQKAVPAKGFAVFGPDRPLTAAPGDTDWAYADLQYTDANGYTINTATYGAGNWQYTATDYNDQGNTVRELDERALRLIIDNQIPAGASADQLATLTVYNTDIKNAAGDTVVTPAGTLVTDTYGPARFAALTDGTIAWVRTHTRTDYDQSAPNAGINPDTTLPYRLATTETTAAYDPGANQDVETITRSLTDYTAPVTGDADGWALGQAGKAITDVDLDGTNSAGDIVKLTRYDTEGRVVETRQPASNGADAGTTKTVYYTTAANASFPECGGKPEWAGLACTTYPAAAPTSSAGTGPSLPSTATTGFTYLLAPTTVVETSGTVTRTSTTTYLIDGRTDTTKSTVTGLTGSTPNTDKKTSYDPATGQATVVTATAADATSTNVTTGYDTWGRQTSYQPWGEQATTTVYDAAGRAASVTDANGSTTYTYDGTDANGKTERRGLATKVDVTTAGSTWTSAGAYDADGSMTTQKLPGGITQINELDNAGEPVGLRYTGQITTINTDGTTTVDPNGGWLSWSIDNDVTGRIAREWTPDGAAFTGPTGDAPGDAIPYDRAYNYDPAGRLTQVKDRTAAATGGDITDPAATPCITRGYGFDRNDNRLTKNTTTSGGDGACTTTGGTTITRAFDTADRPITGANGVGSYVYDHLGRTTTLPASDAPNPADGAITLGYYDNDLARTITQGATSTTLTLDALDRRAVETITDTGGSSQKIRHYTDTSDNPTWVTEGTTWSRYVELIGGALSLTVDQAGVAELAMANNHGDIVTTVDVPSPSTPATTINEWNSYDEYGRSSGGADTGMVRYGWLGAHQRATTDVGLLLMGVRIVNPLTGLFGSIDPVPGGGANRYAYPTDPLNKYDLDGQRWCKRIWKCDTAKQWWRTAKAAVTMTGAFIGLYPTRRFFQPRRVKRWIRHPVRTYRICRRKPWDCAANGIGITGFSAATRAWWGETKKLVRLYRRDVGDFYRIQRRRNPIRRNYPRW